MKGGAGMTEVWIRARQFGLHRAKMALLGPSAPFRGGNPSGGTDTRARSVADALESAGISDLR